MSIFAFCFSSAFLNYIFLLSPSLLLRIKKLAFSLFGDGQIERDGKRIGEGERQRQRETDRPTDRQTDEKQTEKRKRGKREMERNA